MVARRQPLLFGLVLAALVLAGAGCSEAPPKYGQYADVKQDWDSPRPAELEDQLRNRLARTQRDS